MSEETDIQTPKDEEPVRSMPCSANGGAELTVRDEIAIRILPYCVESDDGGTVKDAANELGIELGEYSYRKHWPILAARRAYEYADALLAERSGGHSQNVESIHPETKH